MGETQTKPRRKHASPDGLAAERPLTYRTKSERALRAYDLEPCDCPLEPKAHCDKGALDSYLDEIDAPPEVRFAAYVLGIKPCYHVQKRAGLNNDDMLELDELEELMVRAHRAAARGTDGPHAMAPRRPGRAVLVDEDYEPIAGARPFGATTLPTLRTPDETRAARVEIYRARAVAGVALWHPDDTQQERDDADSCD